MKIRTWVTWISLVCLCRLLAFAATGFTQGREVAPLTPKINPGDYIWKPQISPLGPVVIVISIPKQTLFVYRNGIRIGRSSVSTGKKESPTPVGVFTIKQKNIDHESSTYKGAKMPYMQRLTWDGIAMHGGQLPGYPASHGCVRLPVAFAAKLYEITTNDTTVIITDQKNAPEATSNPGLVFSVKGKPNEKPLPANAFEWQPNTSMFGPVSIVFSLPDQVAYVFRNGIQIGRANFKLNNVSVRGSHVYSALDKVNRSGQREWLAVTSIGGSKAPALDVVKRNLSISADFVKAARSIIEPGTTLILTDLAVSAEPRRREAVPILATE